LGTHSFSTPRTTSARTANTATVTPTKTRSSMGSTNCFRDLAVGGPEAPHDAGGGPAGGAKQRLAAPNGSLTLSIRAHGEL
ncbi:hypothetical protein P3T36_005451, partial [Kitasatospora sp. MAP12-15]